MAYGFIAIGASAGGFEAMRRIVSRFSADFALPVALVQHRSKESTHLPSLLQDCTELRVIEVNDKQPIEPGCCFVAPPDYHLLVDGGHFALSTEGPVGFSRPSIDVFFESVADVLSERAIGVVLTGANWDGARGLRKIADRGGCAIVQDPSTADAATMPDAARKAVPGAHVFPIDEIADYLIHLAGAGAPDSLQDA